MSAVIKSGATLAGLEVRGLSTPPSPAPLSADAVLLAETQNRLAAAEREIENLRREKALADVLLQNARREGHAAGVVEGRDSAEKQAAELLKTLQLAATEALSNFNLAVERLEASLGDLTALALQRITGDPALRNDLVLATARHAVGQLIDGVVIAIEVSGRDFVDDAELGKLLPGQCPVRIRTDLPSGACRLRLKLGEIDLDLDGQKARLQALLTGTAG